LQGVLKLSIQFFEFTTAPIAGTADLQYQLFFRNAGLSFLGKKLPTGGTMDMVLLGDPERKLEDGSLAWLARYAIDEKPTLLGNLSIER
jgi:hypothetical protein